MTALLVCLSVLLAVVGAMQLSQATLGVGVICLGVAFGVWARINQAAEHRKADLKRVDAKTSTEELGLSGERQ